MIPYVFVTAPVMKRATMTIPAAAGTADTISTLAALTAAEKGRLIGCKVLGIDTSGANRAAFVAGDTTASLPQYVAAAADYSEPCASDANTTYVKAASGAAITNVAVVFYLNAVG